MTFPNVFVKVGGKNTYNPSLYLDGKSYTLSVEDETIAEVGVDGSKVYVKGLKTGQTKAKITGDKTQEFVITVRESAGATGWL